MKKRSLSMGQQPINQPGSRLPSVEFFDQISVPPMAGRAETTLEPLGSPETDGSPIDLRHLKYRFGIPTHVKRDDWKAGVHTP